MRFYRAYDECEMGWWAGSEYGSLTTDNDCSGNEIVLSPVVQVCSLGNACSLGFDLHYYYNEDDVCGPPQSAMQGPYKSLNARIACFQQLTKCVSAFSVKANLVCQEIWPYRTRIAQHKLAFFELTTFMRRVIL